MHLPCLVPGMCHLGFSNPNAGFDKPSPTDRAAFCLWSSHGLKHLALQVLPGGEDGAAGIKRRFLLSNLLRWSGRSLEVGTDRVEDW